MTRLFLLQGTCFYVEGSTNHTVIVTKQDVKTHHPLWLMQRENMLYALTINQMTMQQKQTARWTLYCQATLTEVSSLGLGNIGVWMGANDAYYGYERRKNTDFIVSSGIGDWAIDFKTGCISEYIVVKIKGK